MNINTSIIILKIFVVLFALHDLISIIARSTKTPKDDDINSKFGKILNFLFSATNNFISSKEIGERVHGAAAIMALEDLSDRAGSNHGNNRRNHIDNVINKQTREVVKRADHGLDLIPDMPMTTPGKIANGISSVLKNKRMKTKFGVNIQNLFRRLD